MKKTSQESTYSHIDNSTLFRKSLPGEGNGNSVQYSCLGNPMDGGAWRATVQGGHKESDMTERLRKS